MAEIGIGAAANVSADVAKGIFHEAKRHARYVIFYKENVKKFEEKLTTLIAKREGVQQKVDEAERNGEKRKADVKLWFEKVDKAVGEEARKELKNLEDRAKGKCFIGLCPNIKSRYQLSRKAEENAKNFHDLIQEGVFNTVSYRDVPEDMITTSNSNDFEAFESRKQVLEQIMAALKDSAINMMGVYGMSGVGKTTLVKEVARQAKKESSLFNSVVMGVVNPNPDIEKLQDQIAEPLGLYLQEKSLSGRANRLRERLMKEQKILIILDDIWEKLDLEKVGIPFGDDEGKDCKILLTSRDHNVLTTQMDAQITFSLGVLEDKEAWELFKKIAGGRVQSDAELQPIAYEVAKKCAQLPVAITTVAKALRNKGLPTWKDALIMLQRPSPSNFKADMSKGAYNAIKLSYQHLESEEHKQIFLLCSVSLHRQIDLSGLLKYAVGLRLFKHVRTLEETQNRLLTLVSDLKATSLLSSENDDDGSLNMHDLIRDVALAIASEDNFVFFLKDDEVLNLKDWPEEETMAKYKGIVFRFPSTNTVMMNELADELICPQLAFLALDGKDSSMKLPPNICQRMTKLQVLDLNNLTFSNSLPPSISHLIDLQTLCLARCKELGDIAVVGELNNLEILSLAHSDIEKLPREIGKLKKLKLLDLSKCTQLKVIPPGILSRLSRLEELYMLNSFDQWEEATDDQERHGNQVHEQHSNANANASLDELKALSCLHTLEVCILDVKFVPKDFLFSETLRRFKISIGSSYSGYLDKEACSRTLELQPKSTSIDQLGHWVETLMEKTQALITVPQDVEILLSNESRTKEAFMRLKSLCIMSGSELKYIINTNNDAAVNKVEFIHLQSLELASLPQLVSFCCPASIPQHNQLPFFHDQFVFRCLESLSIAHCDQLEHLFSLSVARSLVQLKSLEIKNCYSLRDVIFTDGIEEEKHDVIRFPQLNSLVMFGLLDLTAFCSSYKIEFPSLKTLEIEKSSKLKEFVNNSDENSHHIGAPALFNDKVAIQSLEKLKLSGCGSIEVVFEVGATKKKGLNMDEAHAVTVVDYQLSELWINDLRKLKHVWDRDPQGQGRVSFQNLRKVDVLSCESLKTVFPASIAQHLPQLQHLNVGGCPAVEEIVTAAELVLPNICLEFQFPQLSSLDLRGVGELKCFYPGPHTIALPMLKQLGIKIDQPQSTTGQPFFLVQQANIPHLEVLRLLILGGDVAINICDGIGVFPTDLFFRPVKVLELKLYGSFRINSLLHRFYNLESLQISGGDFSKDLDDGIEESGAPETLSRIRKLKLSSSKVYHIWKKLGWELPNLETLEVWWLNDLINGASLFSLSFKSLTTLTVVGCNRTINLVTPSVVRNLVQLTTMKIESCDAMREIVANEVEEDTSTANIGGTIICFSKLKLLHLESLKSLKSFCTPGGDYTELQFPSLEDLIVWKCPALKIFYDGVLSTPRLRGVKKWSSDKEVRWADDHDLNTTIRQQYNESVKAAIYNKHDLKLSDRTPKLMVMWNRNPGDFKHLREIQFYKCSSLGKYIFTPSSTASLSLFSRLEKLKVKECSTIEAVIMNHDQEEEASTDHNLMISFPRLQEITIESCTGLTSFYLGRGTLEFPCVSHITIGECPRMATFASSLGDLHTTTTAPFFTQQVVCPRLWYLELYSINIQTIWHHQPLPSLSHVEKLAYMRVNGCHNLKYLFPSFMQKHLVRLEQLKIKDCKMMEQVIFSEEEEEEEEEERMLFRKLYWLSLRDLPNLSTFCSANYFEFPQLMKLGLKNCPSLKTFISNSKSSNVGDQLQIHQDAKATNLELANSTLFDERVVLFPSLNKLTIKGVRDCTRLWQLHQLSKDSFSKLNHVLVEGCEQLLTIFPFNMMERLEQLKELQIENCDSVEEILEPQGIFTANEEQTVVVNKFVFPRVERLRFDKLPKLKSFYFGIHATEWPSLKKLEVFDCHQVELFASESAGFNQDSNQQPLFRVNEVTFPILEELSWKPNETFNGTSWYGQVISTAECFRKLKGLGLVGVPKKSAALPNSLIRSLPNLEKLAVHDSSLCQIFEFEGLNAEETQALALLLTQLTELRLSKLPQLTHLWKNVAILQVEECGNLTSLVPASSVSFGNLTTLEVSTCHGFINLMTCSTARRLGLVLQRLSIIDCEMIQEIIASGVDGIQGGIIFTRLECLELSYLPSLASFCLGEPNLEFPALCKVIVRECPKLKVFCEGELRTPKLKRVQLTGDDEEREKVRWEGDLKTTVKRIFEERAVTTTECPKL